MMSKDISGTSMRHLDDVKRLLVVTLGLGERGKTLDADTALLGSMPELDSMAAVNLIAALEDHFGFAVDDDEVNAEIFMTVGSLAQFVDQKMA